MKLRISKDSVRIRLLRSELAKLIQSGRIEETVYFASADESALTYALAIEEGLSDVQLRYKPSELAVILPPNIAEPWCTTEQVGIYAEVDTGKHGVLHLIIEKDFACLDLSDADNLDTFPNPQADAVC